MEKLLSFQVLADVTQGQALASRLSMLESSMPEPITKTSEKLTHDGPRAVSNITLCGHPAVYTLALWCP